MSSMIRSVVTGGLMAVLALATMAAPVQAETPAEGQAALRKAARAAIYGPEVKIKVAGHEFKVKTAQSRMNYPGSVGNIITIQGQISHHLSLRPDDQLNYTIQKKYGRVTLVHIYDPKGYGENLTYFLFGKTYNTEVGIDRVLSTYGESHGSRWRSAANLIVLSIALRRPAVSQRRTQAPPPISRSLANKHRDGFRKLLPAEASAWAGSRFLIGKIAVTERRSARSACQRESKATLCSPQYPPSFLPQESSMSTMFRSLVSGGLMAAMAMVTMVASVQAETPAEQAAALRKAARAAIYGPEAKELKVAGHKFNVKKAKLDSNHEGVTIRGQISHCLTLRPDDQVYYTARRTVDGLVSMEIKIERGGISKVVSKVAGEDAGQFLSKLGQKFDGKWESAAELIVAHIAKIAPDVDSPGKRRPGPYKPAPKK